jgi:hypothetical protein
MLSALLSVALQRLTHLTHLIMGKVTWQGTIPSPLGLVRASVQGLPVKVLQDPSFRASFAGLKQTLEDCETQL